MSLAEKFREVAEAINEERQDRYNEVHEEIKDNKEYKMLLECLNAAKRGQCSCFLGRTLAPTELTCEGFQFTAREGLIAYW